MNIIILDVHHPGDGRINRHMKHVLNEGHDVYHLHINRYYSSLKSGKFSHNGENGFRLNIGNFSDHIINRLFVLIILVFPILGTLVLSNLRKLSFDDSIKTIIHIHDYELLFTGIFLRFALYPVSALVYDRHELFEMNKKNQKIFDKIPRIFEIISLRWIDGLVGVSDEHLISLKKRFRKSIVTIVPNYPDIDNYDSKIIDEKISKLEKESFSLIYFGSLDVSLDRDIYLLLEVMDSVLADFPLSEAYIGGLTSDDELISRFSYLQKKHRGRFFYLGHIAHHDVLEYTSHAHLGFLFMKTDYWVTVSANKIYEYLRYGVIPIIRADVENQDKIVECSLLFSKNDKKEDIISSIFGLLGNKPRLETMILKSLHTGESFSFKYIKSRYDKLYEKVGPYDEYIHKNLN